ncbi:hypothetical protein BN946_scf185042.g73 [Trametes cinnabarina]|uniref:NAD(+) diphosphatase n=1 Tax=Pycnoporus cinnabarinus TaxID=5643 RepID=A0A060S4P5_PYCCI|nr:hypothetical protein BN946_scf185042.g73 [Trametes cinnabarina]
MGEAYVNFLGGSPLNRLSWLRTSQPFLNAVVHAPSTRWVVFKEGQPLVHSRPNAQKQSLARLTTNDVRPLLGSEPIFSQGQHEGELAPTDVSGLDAARLRGPPVVFLGLHETDAGSSNALPSSDFSAKSSAETVIANISGTPYFSLDVSDVAEAQLDEVLKNAAVTKEGADLAFSEPRAAMGNFDAFEAALFAEARSMVDWNARNKKRTYIGASPFQTCADCSPRVCLVQKKWPGKFYSCMAGFIEPGESFEDAVKRELWEEAGVKVWDVRYHSTQPWPYPANLMVGFYARASSSQALRTDLDNELEEARWYSRDEILQVLNNKEGTTLTRRDHRELSAATEKINSNQEPTSSSTANPLAGDAVKEGENAAAPEPPSAPPFKMPPRTAIAGVLIAEWAYGRAGFQPEPSAKRGNL